jgi:hypothetical protein
MSKTVEINGVLLKAPTYVVRLPYGWQVRVPGHTTKSFADSIYGSIAESLEAAKQHKTTLLPNHMDEAYRCNVRERSDKLEPTGIPGVSISISARRGHRAEQVSLQIKRQDVDMSRMYVGTLNTYVARLPSKLEAVKQLVIQGKKRQQNHA